MTSDDQQLRLLTIADHEKWETIYKPVLDLAEQKRDETFDSAEAERFAIAADAILRAYQTQRKLGLSKANAGDELEHRWIKGIGYTMRDLHAVLRAIGWEADHKRAHAHRMRNPVWRAMFTAGDVA